MREARRRPVTGSESDPSQIAFSQHSFEPEDPAELTYELIQPVSKREAIRLLRIVFGGGSPQVDMERLNRLTGAFREKGNSRDEEGEGEAVGV